MASPVVIDHLQYYLTRALAPRVTVHGVYMEVMGMGVLITGESGIGKSELALELLSRDHRLIADDAVEFVRVGPDVIVGQCPTLLSDFLEVRGLGILDIRLMFGETAVRHKKKLHLIVHLESIQRMKMSKIDRLQTTQRTRSILDVDIPEVALFVGPGRNLAVLVEAATRANILRQLRAAITCRAAPTPPSIPVLLLSGHHDRLVNAECSLALAQRWGCDIRLHPTAGHDIPLDDGEWVARQVREWLVAQGARP